MANRRRASPEAPGGSMGDLIEDLHKEGHITARRFQAAVMFLAELRGAHGTSAGLVSETAERVDAGVRQRLCPPGGPSGTLPALDARLNRLRSHERRLMAYLIRHRELVRGGLSDFGRTHSGYKTARTTRAFAVGQIAALLDTLAEEYLGPEQAA